MFGQSLDINYFWCLFCLSVTKVTKVTHNQTFILGWGGYGKLWLVCKAYGLTKIDSVSDQAFSDEIKIVCVFNIIY